MQKTCDILAGRTDRRTSGVGLGMKDDKTDLWRRSVLVGENQTTAQRSKEESLGARNE